MKRKIAEAATKAAVAKAAVAKALPEASPDEPVKNPQASRETVESIVVAVILAFLFRGFVAEAFVIPTGSMAPTLHGRHMDIVCPQCRYKYDTGASMENVENGQRRGEVIETTCPICHFSLQLKKADFPNERSFNGDRILVSKFAYQLYEPERWDVIVFKYPGNAKQNYIKRLVGLPGETIRIRHGDIHTLDINGAAHIVRKPAAKLEAMLQLVDDTDHIAPALLEAGWPLRWQQDSRVTSDQAWQASKDGSEYRLQAGSKSSWLRYRHLAPVPGDWNEDDSISRPLGLGSEGKLIADYYSYNDSRGPMAVSGTAWVGDLALECRVNVQSDEGELLLDLVEGGAHHECRIDIVTGKATLTMREFNGEARRFGDEDGGPLEVTAQTKLRGRGRHTIRFANCDDQLYLWIDNRIVEFQGPTTFRISHDVVPQWSRQDPGDMAPLAIGGKGANLTVKSLRVLRDLYYLAQEAEQSHSEYRGYRGQNDIDDVFSDPHEWSTTDLFRSRRYVDFSLGENNYFPLGDNSPQSKDARLWSEGSRRTGYRDPPPYVEQKLLIGKALVVYWPHGWRPNSTLLSRLTANIAFIPNFGQMRLIR